MHIIPCPFCGPRDETEFRYGAEAGKQRGTAASSAEQWARYLYFQDNPKGDSSEIWVHLTCCEFFVLERNSVTHEIYRTRSIRKEDRP
jgi:sarcosine oxidase subunit delta